VKACGQSEAGSLRVIGLVNIVRRAVLFEQQTNDGWRIDRKKTELRQARSIETRTEPTETVGESDSRDGATQSKLEMCDLYF